jgi:tRNA(fMet)-specific endonuclease VapC
VAVSRLCLDTSAYSQFKRGHEPVVEIIDAAEWIGVSAVVLGELRTGFALGKREQTNERELASFLRSPVVHVVDVDTEVSRIYAEIVVALRRAGTPVPTNDIWIAAAAAREGATVLTYDEHFRVIGRIGSRVLMPA